MTHLQVRDRLACGISPEGETGLPYKEFELVACTACRESIYGQAADRLVVMEGHFTAEGLDRAVSRLATPRIEGSLGDMSKVDPTADIRTRFLQRQATMSDDEKLEGFRRVTSMVADICPSCAGSIKYNEHDTDCRGPDPLEWDLTEEEVTAELEVQGIDVEASRKRFRNLLDELTAKHGGG